VEELDQIFAKRAASRPWYRGGTLIGAVLVHVVLAGAAFLSPRLFADRHEPPEFVAVSIVPAAALGQIAPPPEPEPAAPPPREEPEPIPEPEPEPEPEPPPPPKPDPRPRTPPPERSTSTPKPRERAPAPEPAPLDVARPPSEPRRRQGSPQGSPLATGGPAEITGFDDPDFTYSYYADLLLARIRSAWERPPIGGEIQMAISFRIDQNGTVSDVRIVSSSGYNSFDRAGMRAVQTATLPPLPKSYRKGSLGVRLIIH
jgi:protein TonB